MMERMLKWGVLLVVVSGVAAGAAAGGSAHAETLTVGAAPSLKPAFQAIVPMFEKEYGVTVHVEYGPSQTQRRRIEGGAPIDVFLPASVEELGKLQDKDLVLSGEPRIYAETSLVLVMSAASSAIAVSVSDVLPNRAIRLALGDPTASALGDITARVLTKLDPGYRKRSRLVYVPHSEDVMGLIRTGKADVGIVYRVDAINSGHVRIIEEIPIGTYAPVQFGGAAVSTCRPESLQIAAKFLDFVTSPRIQKLMIQYGFDPVLSKAVTG